MNCGTKCAKYTLAVFNLLFWLAGGVLFGVSIWVLVDGKAADFLQIVTPSESAQPVSNLKAASITLCVVGSVILVVCFLGCCGALKESSRMLNVYAVIVLILFIAQIAAGILGVFYKNELLDGMATAMNETVTTQYGQDGFTSETEAFDFMQISFKCCGVKDPWSEWESSEWRLTSGNDSVPDACCSLVDVKATPPEPVNRTECSAAAERRDTSNAYYHHKGCYNFLYDWAVTHTAILMGVAFGFAGLQIFVIFLACCASTCMKRQQYQKM